MERGILKPVLKRSPNCCTYAQFCSVQCAGYRHRPNDSILSIDGLWALGFGAGNAISGPYNTLFFTAGPNDEGDGLFGTLVPIPAELAEGDEP